MLYFQWLIKLSMETMRGSRQAEFTEWVDRFSPRRATTSKMENVAIAYKCVCTCRNSDPNHFAGYDHARRESNCLEHRPTDSAGQGERGDKIVRRTVRAIGVASLGSSLHDRGIEANCKYQSPHAVATSFIAEDRIVGRAGRIECGHGARIQNTELGPIRALEIGYFRSASQLQNRNSI